MLLHFTFSSEFSVSISVNLSKFWVRVRFHCCAMLCWCLQQSQLSRAFPRQTASVDTTARPWNTSRKLDKNILITLPSFSHIHIPTSSSVLHVPSDHPSLSLPKHAPPVFTSHHRMWTIAERPGRAHTHTVWVAFSAASSRAPCDAVGWEVPTHSWHVGLCSAAGGVRGSLTCPLASPPLARGERERGCFRHRGPDILLYPHFLIQGPFTDWWQRGYSSSKFLPSCFQTAGKEVNEYTEEEECEWGKCQ